ncbi:MAG: helicase HerA domain-containing protein [Halovenus sp.]
MSSPPEEIEISDDGYTIPVMDVMTGRGFITGKSGSGKSNTGSVIAEELLEAGLTVVIIDTDGEYFGLKQEYELLHVGGDDTCDVEVGVEQGEELARLAIEENVPIILDVSAYLDPTEAKTLIETTLRHLFVMEKTARKPLLVFVEEVHEYIPERGGLDDLGETLVQVAKRGRKRGLGLCGMSQRPAAVDKDFITQCDWLVWHRLTWENDTQVVGRIMDSNYAESVQELEDGEAFLMTDWEEEVRKIKFRRKKTFDAGATPGLEEFDPPDMRSVSTDLIENLEAIGTSDEPAGQDEEPSDDAEAETADSSETESSDRGTTEESDTGDATDSEDESADDLVTVTPREPRSRENADGPALADQSPVTAVALEFAYLVAYAFDSLLAAVGGFGRHVGRVLARQGRVLRRRLLGSSPRVSGDGGTHRRERSDVDPLAYRGDGNDHPATMRRVAALLVLLVVLGVLGFLIVG